LSIIYRLFLCSPAPEKTTKQENNQEIAIENKHQNINTKIKQENKEDTTKDLSDSNIIDDTKQTEKASQHASIVKQYNKLYEHYRHHANSEMGKSENETEQVMLNILRHAYRNMTSEYDESEQATKEDIAKPYNAGQRTSFLGIALLLYIPASLTSIV
jgi:hypothetical protein